MSFGQHISSMAANTGQVQNFRPRRVGGETGVKKTTTTESHQSGEAGESHEAEAGQKTAYHNAVSGPSKRRRRYGRHISGGQTSYGRGTQQGQTPQLSRPGRRVAVSRQERQRMLNLAFSDTTRETQARFLSDNGPLGGPDSNTGKLSTMVSRLITMCKNQLGQYTGDELYKRADFQLDEETLECRWVLPEELPWEELAFPSTADAFRDYLL